MILVFNDRNGHQMGTANFGISAGSHGTTLHTSVAAGDILRACLNTSGVYQLEVNGSCGGTSTAGAGNNEGPATINGTMNGYTGTGGEYYWGDQALIFGSIVYHHDAVMGGSTILAGSNKTYVHIVDAYEAWGGGSYLMNNTTGNFDNAYGIYPRTVTEVLFGKANGLGDPEVMCSISPIEIGNRVWNDADSDGIQDAGEAPISGVTVELVKNGSVIATATTDASGNYYFSNGPGTNTTSAKYNITQLMANMQYTVRIPNVQGGSKQAALGTNSLTIANVGGSGQPDVRDSDGTLVGNNAEVTVMTTSIPVAGANNHTFDFGFTSAPTCTVSIACNPSPQTSCTPANGSATTTVTGGQGNITYLWSSGETTSSITGKVAGTYTVTVTDDFLPGCTHTCQAIIGSTVTLPTAQCDPMPNTNCATPNGSATVTTNANQILWSNGGTTATITGLSANTYTVTVTNTTTGCTNTCQAVVGSTTTLPTAQCDPMPNTNCATPNGSATVTTNANQILWSNGGTTATITGLSANTYTVTVTNTTTGCTNTCQAVVGSTTTLPTAQCDPMPNTNCATPNGSATVTTNANQILWSNGGTTATITGLSANTYTVTVTNTTTGCTNTCQAVVGNTTVNPTCNIGVNSQPSCANLTGGSVTVAPSPVGTYTYNWSDIGSGSANRTGLTGGTYTVTVTNPTTNCTGVCNVTLNTPTNCCNIAAIVPQNLECLDNGTPGNITDNRIRFNALVTNTNASLTSYNVTINGGTTITPNANVPYGVTQFTLGPGTAGGGATFTVTVTDSATPGCTQTFQVIDPGTCSPAIPECPTPKCGTATIQVNGN